MSFKVLVFDTHPVQYRVPVWQTMNEALPGCLHVVYASDCSVRGHTDPDFARTFSWDEPLLSGYDHTILNCEHGKPLRGWGSLTGEGVKQQIKNIKPDAILLTGLNYRFDIIAFLHAKWNNIPVWLRCETQDHAFQRSTLKSIFRSLVYRIAYLGIDKFFFIGKLNREHFCKHGVSSSKLKAACYGTVDRFRHLGEKQKLELRTTARELAEVNSSSFVIGFSGKFIDKKNPELLFEMLEYLPEELRNKLHLYFIGSGPLGNKLRILGDMAYQRFGVHTFFAGFVNQTELAPHYLAMDIMVLPSRRMGETWGLVANEAMQAGCAVIVSDAVGCAADFGSWDRFRTFKEGGACELAACVNELAHFSRQFNWAKQGLKKYSIRATADAMVEEMIPEKKYHLAAVTNQGE